jgi:hypothetical protein
MQQIGSLQDQFRPANPSSPADIRRCLTIVLARRTQMSDIHYKAGKTGQATVRRRGFRSALVSASPSMKSEDRSGICPVL